ncbi:IS200/IS605 family transposase [Neolewinella aurantiaca]|uniref:IS200/IS605 family transposase n=1 Tax=Neolewinella aurantiaca TaxID=2602767 RepID=A0A5C7FQZ3_9BACT|nr:IS200/IS605 family transposase [Neolewinella aurantiaca]TXF88871.1 IS200/IS605 family transposase [Neolewinella aurantiaca]
MSSTYIRTVYQIVFSTKYREPVMIGREQREKLYSYMGAIVKNKGCTMYQGGGVEDHLHLIIGLHPSVALASLVKDIKLASSRFIRHTNLFPDFRYWQVGYGAFTYTPDALRNLILYAENQEAHHRKENSSNELRRLLHKNGVEFDEQYFE